MKVELHGHWSSSDYGKRVLHSRCSLGSGWVFTIWDHFGNGWRQVIVQLPSHQMYIAISRCAHIHASKLLRELESNGVPCWHIWVTNVLVSTLTAKWEGQCHVRSVGTSLCIQSLPKSRDWLTGLILYLAVARVGSVRAVYHKPLLRSKQVLLLKPPWWLL